MEKVRPWCGQPSDRGRLKNRTEHQLESIERWECVKLLGVLVDSKFSFGKHVKHVLSVRNQMLYLLSQLRKRGPSDKSIGIVYDAVVLSKVLYALSGWGGIHKSNAD